MRNSSLTTPAAREPVTELAAVAALAKGIEVIELSDRQERKLNELRSHIDDLLTDGWAICARNPLTLQQGSQICYVLHGMLISDTLN